MTTQIFWSPSKGNGLFLALDDGFSQKCNESESEFLETWLYKALELKLSLELKECGIQRRTGTREKQRGQELDDKVKGKQMVADDGEATSLNM